MKKMFVGLLCMIMLSLGLNTNFSYAQMDSNDEFTQKVDLFIENVASNENIFSAWESVNVVKANELYNLEHNLTGFLYKLYNAQEEYVGYAIYSIDYSSVVEYSMNIPPYEKFIKELNIGFDGDMYYIYESGGYAISNGTEFFAFDEFGSLNTTHTGIAPCGILPNVSPQLQGSDNCIVAAISNMIWYEGNNRYPFLISGLSFANVKSRINTYMLNHGGYANSNISYAIEDYVNIRNSGYELSDVSQWNPSLSLVKQIIDGGRPLLLGYAAGSPYSSTVGHMTLCVGYSGSYVYLADGHSSSIVSKIWNSSYNDFVYYMSLRQNYRSMGELE